MLDCLASMMTTQIAASATQLQEQAETLEEAMSVFRMLSSQRRKAPDAVALRRQSREASAEAGATAD